MDLLFQLTVLQVHIRGGLVEFLFLSLQLLQRDLCRIFFQIFLLKVTLYIFQFAALFLKDPFLEYGLCLDLIDGGQGFLTGFF